MAPISPEYTSECVYTILHSKDLAKIFRSGRSGTFTERKKWATAEKLLRAARSVGQVVPIIFAPGENIWEVTHFAELEELKMNQDEDGKWSSTVSVVKLTKIPPPRPNKTQLTVCSTGKKLPKNHIRPYVLVLTPKFLKPPQRPWQLSPRQNRDRLQKLERSGKVEEIPMLTPKEEAALDRAWAKVNKKAK